MNESVARRLEEVAQLLEDQGANRFRVQAYRRGAATLRRSRRSVENILNLEGPAGLRKLAGIGEGLAQAITSLARTGTLPILERLRGESDPVALLASVPGVGKIFAARLHHDLGLDTLEDLEAAAHDGRLSTIAGMGTKRILGIIDSLEARLGRSRRSAVALPVVQPPVAELLDVDREYRAKSARGTLATIAPRRWNPGGESWLPVLHTIRGERHYTAMYSNTPRAHRAGKVHDWVVLYYDGGAGERQSTVITGGLGPLVGKRIVPGREEECVAYYELPAAVRRVPSVSAPTRGGG